MILGLLLLVVAGAHAQGSVAAPQPCCTDSAFSASGAITIGTQRNGKGVAEQGFYNMVYNYNTKMVWTEFNMTDMSTMKTSWFTILQDHNTNQNYVTVKSGTEQYDGNCYIQPNGGIPMYSPCIPDDATYMGPLTINSGSGAMQANAWSFSMNGNMIKMVVSQDTCTPIYRVVTGTFYGEDQLQTVLYYNQMASSAADQAKLTIPSGCTPNPTLGKQCCTSHQFTATVGVSVSKSVNGVGSASKGVERTVYDSDAKMAYVDAHMVDAATGKTTAYKVHQDFNTMKAHLTVEDGSCYVMDIPEKMVPPCIPDDAQYLETLTIGSGDNAFKATAFEVHYATRNVTMVVADGTCTPVSETTAGRIWGEDQQRTSQYFDFQPYISDADRKLLAVPLNCDTPMPSQKPMGTMMPASAKPYTPAAGSMGNPCSAQAIASGQLYFAYPGDNTKFIECDLLGNPGVLSCPTGLIWQQSMLACGYPVPGTN